MENFIIKETTVWGDHYKAKSPTQISRLTNKKQILQSRPFIDHYKIYAFKPAHQRGPARETQTFIVSYTYMYDNLSGNEEAEFIEKLTSIGLRFYKEQCVFNGKDSYRILIMDSDVILEEALRLLR